MPETAALPGTAARRPADGGRARRAVAAAAAAAVLLRLPFLATGLSTDEGGYAYVARRWAQGAALYTDAWLDRPQGLLLVYRLLLLPDDSGGLVRAGVPVAGAAITVALGVTGWLLAGPRTGVTAAWLYAVLGVAPHLEGITLNGELLAGVPAAAAVALAVAWWRRGRRTALLAAAGLCAGTALTMKQSGVDGLAVGLVVVWLAGGRRWRAAAVFAAGAAVPAAAAVAHGATVGLGAYWQALAGYQLAALGGAGADAGSRWTDLGRHAGSVALDLTLVTAVSLAGWRVLDRDARRVAAAWLAAALVGVNLGGSYWPHYFMQPLPVLVLVAAAAVAAVRAPRWRAALAAVLVLPVLGWLAALVPMSPRQRERTVPYAALAARDDRIAAQIRARTRPDDRIYVLESEAYLYLAARRVSPYPYLWGKPIDKIPDALPRLRAMLASPQRPELVVLDTPPQAVDPTGGIAAALAAHYRPETVVDGVPLLRAVR